MIILLIALDLISNPIAHYYMLQIDFRLLQQKNIYYYSNAVHENNLSGSLQFQFYHFFGNDAGNVSKVWNNTWPSSYIPIRT